ncbi:retron St85 family RNA-directed DNA polymerase [Leisingera sp. D0M16]|uniref:retron St85 family RNA-directed DNA polymerase n=1 Tax=Leisingera coralii TaxID=3351347 RepID=UPI003B77DFDD
MSAVFEKVRRRFAFSRNEFYLYVQTAPHRYKTYKIPKRSGKKKRTISQPSKDLKAIQRFLLAEFLLPKFKFSDHATAYRKGLSICDNVTPHVSNRFLLKMDFEDFFPSIRSGDFVDYLLREGVLDNESDAEMMARIFFQYQEGDLRLSIGSPGSPPISNALLKHFDDSVAELIHGKGIAYTRYSDDLSFSTNEKDALFSVSRDIHRLTEESQSPHLKINNKKTVFSSTKFNRHITGVTISNEGKMSLGRQTKRSLRTRVFEAKIASPEELASLKGYLAYANQIEPDFICRLRDKYTKQMSLVDQAFASPRRHTDE